MKSITVENSFDNKYTYNIGSPSSLHTKTLNESDNSLQINPARLYTNETPRTLKGHIQKEKKPERMSISLSTMTKYNCVQFNLYFVYIRSCCR